MANIQIIQGDFEKKLKLQFAFPHDSFWLLWSLVDIDGYNDDVTPANRVALAPIQTFLPMWIGA